MPFLFSITLFLYSISAMFLPLSWLIIILDNPVLWPLTEQPKEDEWRTYVAIWPRRRRILDFLVFIIINNIIINVLLSFPLQNNMILTYYYCYYCRPDSCRHNLYDLFKLSNTVFFIIYVNKKTKCFCFSVFIFTRKLRVWFRIRIRKTIKVSARKVLKKSSKHTCNIIVDGV